ncbi:MAG: hypothetical protein ABSF70_05385 [Terracidiphilus sp.]|jgi:hypothetical protein
MDKPMLIRTISVFIFFLLWPRGCSDLAASDAPRLKHGAIGDAPEIIALYEAWFGHPKHISVGYSSQDPAVIVSQIRKAKAMGISAFVVDWYGDREPFIDRSYALIQTIAASEKFQVAMMYDETDEEDGSTDEALADFTMFHDSYLSSKARGHQAYLTYEGRPLIFIFPKAGHTDWKRVRALTDKWNPAPLLIQENLPGPDADAFDGFYAWVSPAQGGDGSNWGEQYLRNFYGTMRSKYSDKIIVGGIWSSFDDSKASWGLNRHIAARCGQTFADTSNLWHKYFPQDDLLPFVMVETWNDHEEGTAIEDGIPSCDTVVQGYLSPHSQHDSQPPLKKQ